MHDMKWAIRKKQSEVLDKQAAYAGLVQKFGNPAIPQDKRTSVMTPQLKKELLEFRDDVVIQMNTLRSLFQLNSGYQR